MCHPKVITFNFGLHDGPDNETDYATWLTNITDTLEAAAGANTTLLYFTTTLPQGSSEPDNAPDNVKVRDLNTIAKTIMDKRNILVVDLYATMKTCGPVCEACKPHCEPEGYQFLVDHAIAPAVKAHL